MFEKILYPTDFSDVSKKALGYVKSLKAAGTRQIIVLRVIDEIKLETISRTMTNPGFEGDDFLKNSVQRYEKEAYEEMKDIETQLVDAGFDVKIMVDKGSPHSRILQIAEEEDVSAIILGSHGRSNLGVVFLGSVSDHVIRNSKRPVIVIKR